MGKYKGSSKIDVGFLPGFLSYSEIIRSYVDAPWVLRKNMFKSTLIHYYIGIKTHTVYTTALSINGTAANSNSIYQVRELQNADVTHRFILSNLVWKFKFWQNLLFNIFLLETLQDIWYFDILRKKEFFYISNYHIYWLELSYFYHFCSFQHFYLVTQVKDFDINPL